MLIYKIIGNVFDKFKISQHFFISDACGVGRCIDTDNGFECQCPLGRAGRRCEREIKIYEPAFHNDAFIAHQAPKQPRKLQITLKIKPISVKDGILFYSSETEDGFGDFISLAIRNKHLELRISVANGKAVIKTENKGLKVYYYDC